MDIFVDHCVHADVVNALREYGYHVVRATDVGMEQSSDEEIFRYAQKSSRVLLTFDKDFGNIKRFDIIHSCGVVIVYVDRMSRDMMIRYTIGFFQSADKETLQGTLFIVEPQEIKSWPRR